MRPSFRTAIWSAKPSASSWSWVTRMVVAFASAKMRATSRRTPSRNDASSELKGSSSRTTLGRIASSAGECNPLLLAPRELVGIAPLQARQPDHLHQVGHAFSLAARHAEPDVVSHGQVREECSLLRDVADASPLRAHKSPAVIHDLPADDH